MPKDFTEHPRFNIYTRHCGLLFNSSTERTGDGYKNLANFVISGLSTVELDLPDLFLRFYCALHADQKYLSPSRAHLTALMQHLQPEHIPEAHREEFREMCVHVANMLCARLSALCAEAMTTTASIMGVTIEVKVAHEQPDQDAAQPDDQTPFLH